MPMDVYHELLGIPPAEQPPNHYRLLGIPLFEGNESVIKNGCRRQYEFARSARKRDIRAVESLLNELMSAKLVLLNPEQKEAYDSQLRGSLGPLESLGGAALGGSLAAVGADPPRSPLRPASILNDADSTSSSELNSESWGLPAESPPAPAPPSLAEWLVGSARGSDVRIRSPWVSRQHCRIRRSAGNYYIKDLQSLNGTFINGVQVTDEVPVDPLDVVTLGRKTRIPWPLPENMKRLEVWVFSIGRSPDNDFVIDDPSVSQHHAQLVMRGREFELQDLDSKNGTRIGRLDNKVRTCILEPHLSVFFGNTKVFAEQLMNKMKAFTQPET